MKKNTIIGIIVVIILIILGILVIKHAENRDNLAPKAKQYSIIVKTFIPSKENVTLTLPYLALIQSDNDVMISSRIAARIEYLKTSGTTVSKGEIIAKLDKTTIEANLESVKSQLNSANVALKNLQASHTRTLELLKIKGASIEQSEMEESKISETQAKVESLQQMLNDLNNSLTYAVIKATVSGVIAKTMLNVGDMAMPGQPIGIISAKSGTYLKISMPSNLKIYGVTFRGKSYKAIPLENTFNSLAEYKVIPNDVNLISGERVEVNVEVYNDNAIKLPFDAILNREGKSYVFIRDNDKAVPYEVQVLQAGEDGIVVNNSDIAGKEIVVEKQDVLLKLLSGVSIKVKEN
jgi:RND family efflux transporter MFP subunit